MPKRTINNEHYDSPEAFIAAVESMEKITSIEMTLGPDLPQEGKYSKHLMDWTLSEILDRMIDLNATHTAVELGKHGDLPGWFHVSFRIDHGAIYQKPKQWLRRLAWFIVWRVPMAIGPTASWLIDYATQGGKKRRGGPGDPEPNE